MMLYVPYKSGAMFLARQKPQTTDVGASWESQDPHQIHDHHHRLHCRLLNQPQQQASWWPFVQLPNHFLPLS